MSAYMTPRYNITVDEDACGNAIDCLKCVKACLDHGSNCLGYMNKEIPDLDEFVPKKLEDIEHKIISAFMIDCDGCSKCVDVCPKNAISIEAPEPQAPRALITKENNIIMCSTLADGTVVTPEE